MRSNKCCVVNCENTSHPLHRFPDPYIDRARFYSWVKSAGHKDLFWEKIDDIYKKRRVCEKHFSYKQRSYWDPDGRLRKNAIPDIFLGAVSNISPAVNGGNEKSQVHLIKEMNETSSKEFISNDVDGATGQIPLIISVYGSSLNPNTSSEEETQCSIPVQVISDDSCSNRDMPEILDPETVSETLDNSLKLPENYPVEKHAVEECIEDDDCRIIDVAKVKKEEELDILEHSLKEEEEEEVEEGIYPVKYEFPKLEKYEENFESFVKEEPLKREESISETSDCKILLSKFGNEEYIDLTSSDLCSDERSKFVVDNSQQQASLRETDPVEKIHIETFNCSTCKFVTTKFEFLKQHIINHTGKKLFICYHCDYNTQELKDLRHHIKEHFDFIIEMKLPKRSRSSKLSNKKKIRVNRKRYKCKHCEFRACNSSEMRKHVLTHKGKHFKCKICQYRSCTKSILQLHIRAVHLKQRKEESHTSDDTDIKEKNSFESHIDEKKPVRCSICPFRANDFSAFKNHMIIHLGLKYYKCEFCDHTVLRRSFLKDHMKTHVNPYRCNYCNYGGRTYGTLLNHMLLHTQRETFSCDICGYKTKTVVDLKNHMKDHTDRTVYACTLCGFQTDQRGRLNVHMSSVHSNKDRNFTCPFCGVKTLLSNLKTHMKMNHVGETIPSQKKYDIRNNFKMNTSLIPMNKVYYLRHT